jgi:hypothetical protein
MYPQTFRNRPGRNPADSCHTGSKNVNFTFLFRLWNQRFAKMYPQTFRKHPLPVRRLGPALHLCSVAWAGGRSPVDRR